MGAFFLNPGILGFAALAGLPVLIHLLNRQRFKRVPWAAMRFLEAAFRKTYRRVQVENLILLLLRTAAVLLAVLAMARPFTGGASAGIFRDPVHLVVVLDDSLSMDAREGTASRLDRAREALSSRFESLPNRSLVTVLLATRPGQALIRDAAPLEARDALAQVRPTDLRADLPAALAAAAPLAGESALPKAEVVLATDLQATGWPAGGKDPALEPLVKRKIPVRILDAGGEAPNTALVSTRLLSRVVSAGRPLRVEGRIRHAGSAPRERLEALLLVDGTVRDRQVIDRIDPGEEASATLFTTLPDPGAYALEVRIAEDALARDDRRGLGVRADQGLEVLLVDGDPMPEAEDSEAYFLARALSPLGSASPVRLTQRDLYRFGPQDGLDLKAFDVVALLNVGALDPAQASRLEAYVRDGGHLLVSLGDNTVLSEWGKLDWLPGTPGPFRAPPQGGAERFARLKVADPSHPACLSLRHSPSLDAMNIRSFVSVEPAADPAVRIPWSFAVEGSPDAPAVLERPLGSGRVILLATALDKEWGDLPLSFDYVALVHDLVYAAAAGSQVREALAGEPLTLEVAGEHAGQSLRLTSPEGRTEGIVGEPLASRLKLTTPPLEQAGPWRVSFGNPEEVVERFAVNPDPAESDPARIPLEALKARMPDLEVLLEDRASPEASAGVSEHWRSILYAVGAILTAESLLAWLFGRRR